MVQRRKLKSWDRLELQISPSTFLLEILLDFISILFEYADNLLRQLFPLRRSLEYISVLLGCPSVVRQPWCSGLPLSNLDLSPLLWNIPELVSKLIAQSSCFEFHAFLFHFSSFDQAPVKAVKLHTFSATNFLHNLVKRTWFHLVISFWRSAQHRKWSHHSKRLLAGFFLSVL